MGELIFNSGMLLFFIAMTIYSGKIEIWQDFFGARYWPMMLLIAADLIFAAKTHQIFKFMPVNERKLKINTSAFKEIGNQRLLLAFAITSMYAILLPYLGFFITTFLYAIGLSLILGLRHVLKLVSSSFVTTLGIYAIFVWGLDIMVPRGSGVLYYFGLWLETLV